MDSLLNRYIEGTIQKVNDMKLPMIFNGDPKWWIFAGALEQTQKQTNKKCLYQYINYLGSYQYNMLHVLIKQLTFILFSTELHVLAKLTFIVSEQKARLSNCHWFGWSTLIYIMYGGYLYSLVVPMSTLFSRKWNPPPQRYLSNWSFLVGYCYLVWRWLYIHVYYITRIWICILSQRQLWMGMGWSTYHILFILVIYSIVIATVNIRDPFGILRYFLCQLYVIFRY
jgi:hypothetical protein